MPSLWGPPPTPRPAVCCQEHREPCHQVQHVSPLLQLSASPAVGCTGPALNPTSASARKAGTGGTAIKVSENQSPESVPGLLIHAMQKWWLPEPFHHHQQYLTPLFFFIFNPNNKRLSILHNANYLKKGKKKKTYRTV